VCCGSTGRITGMSRRAPTDSSREVVEHHIRNHVVDPFRSAQRSTSQAAEQLVEIVHSYLTLMDDGLGTLMSSPRQSWTNRM